jgi:hypothetical protein
MYHLSNLIMSAPSLCIYLEQFAKFLNWENFSMDFSSLPKICHVNTLSLINYTDALFIVSTVVLVNIFYKLELQEHELKTWCNYTKRNFTFLETFSEINSKKITVRKTYGYNYHFSPCHDGHSPFWIFLRQFRKEFYKKIRNSFMFWNPVVWIRRRNREDWNHLLLLLNSYKIY